MYRTVPPLLGVLGMIIMFLMVEFITGLDVVPLLQLGPMIPLSSTPISDSLLGLLRSVFIVGIAGVAVWVAGFSSYKMVKTR